MSSKLPLLLAMTGFRGTQGALIATVLTTLLASSPRAHAQTNPPGAPDAALPSARKGAEPSAADRKRARRLFEEAAELESKREWSAATDRLMEALMIVETPGLRYHLAYCQEEQGLMLEALANYERAQQMIAAGSKAPDVAELLAPKRDALLARIPKLRVRARAPAVIERVAIDGVPVAPAQIGAPIALNPGRRRVTAWAKGQPGPLEREVVLSEGREASEEFTWPAGAPAAGALPVAVAPPPPASWASPQSEPEAPSSGVSARTAVLITEVSLTAIALGVGIGFLASSSSAGNDADVLRGRLPEGACGNQPLPQYALACAELPQANDRERDHERIAVAGFIAAGAGAVATVATWVLWKSPARSTALEVNVSPTLAGGKLGLRARF